MLFSPLRDAGPIRRTIELILSLFNLWLAAKHIAVEETIQETLNMSSNYFLTSKAECRTVEAMKVESLTDMRAVWRRAGQAGGRSRANGLSAKRKREIARLGGLAKAARKKAA